MIEATTGSTMLLPPKPGHCRICAVKHDPKMPHNATSLFYQVRFKMRYGRDGTWADAIAHLPKKHHDAARAAIGEHWTEPPAGSDPVCEPIDG